MTPELLTSLRELHTLLTTFAVARRTIDLG